MFLFLCALQYEFKVKGIRKVRSNIIISTQGVKVTKRKRKRVSSSLSPDCEAFTPPPFICSQESSTQKNNSS